MCSSLSTDSEVRVVLRFWIPGSLVSRGCWASGRDQRRVPAQRSGSFASASGGFGRVGSTRSLAGRSRSQGETEGNSGDLGS